MSVGEKRKKGLISRENAIRCRAWHTSPYRTRQPSPGGGMRGDFFKNKTEQSPVLFPWGMGGGGQKGAAAEAAKEGAAACVAGLRSVASEDWIDW